MLNSLDPPLLHVELKMLRQGSYKNMVWLLRCRMSLCSHNGLMQHLILRYIYSWEGWQALPSLETLFALPVASWNLALSFSEWIMSGQKLSEGRVFCPLEKSDSPTLNTLKRLIAEDVQLLMLCASLVFRDLSSDLCLGNGWMDEMCML